MKRAELVRPETRFVLKHYQTTKILEDQIKQNKIPKRVSHNDTKLNNVRFDIETKEAVCLVDLDTVMAGSVYMILVMPSELVQLVPMKMNQIYQR